MTGTLFSFCADCGRYLRPDEGEPIDRQGQTVLLCRECLNTASKGRVFDAMKTFFENHKKISVDSRKPLL